MKFSNGNYPASPETDMVTYKPLKNGGDKEKDNDEKKKSGEPETQE